MKPLKHVLTTTDLTPESLEAVRYAAELAGRDSAELAILYVPPTLEITYSHITPTKAMQEMEKEIRDAAEARLGAWIDENLGKDTAVSVLLRDGVPDEEICRTASELGASVIVMATRGRKGLAHALLGSVTERVIGKAPCPVIVVPPSAET